MDTKLILTLSTVSLLGWCPADVNGFLIEEIFSWIFLGRAAKFNNMCALVHNIDGVPDCNKNM